MELLKNYKEQTNLRQSFNELAKETFGIEFEEWYKKGYWNERYIPYSYVKENKVIANVSVNALTLTINGEKREAIQIGTVMTEKSYRGQGLSRDLLQKVLDDYKNQVDLFYLFANHTVLDFYPKFGFQRKSEYLFSKNLPSTPVTSTITKLDMAKEASIIEDYINNRTSLSQSFGTSHSEGITFFHCLYVFPNDLYYVESADSLVIYKVIDQDVHVFDVIGKKEGTVAKVIQSLSGMGNKVILHFTPDQPDDYEAHQINSIDDVLFVLTNTNLSFPTYFKHPITSQA